MSTEVVVTATRTAQPPGFALASTPGPIGTVSPTTTLSITASVFQSSWATAAITVPFPSYYGNQIQLSYDWGSRPTASNPSRLGGTEATSGVASLQAAATNPAVSRGGSGAGGSGSGGGFHWPTWATAVAAGVGGAALLAILIGCCIWRKRRNKKKYQRKQAIANIGRGGGAQDRHHSRPEGLGREHKRGTNPLAEKNDSGSSLTVVGSGRSTPSGRSRKDEKPAGEKRRLKKGPTGPGDYRDPANGGYIDVPSRASGERPRSRGPPRHYSGADRGGHYPPYPVPPLPIAAGVDLHGPAPPQQYQNQRGHSPYHPAGLNDLAAGGYAPYPTDEHGNPLGPPISPFRATHRRYGSAGTDDSGYDTPGNRTFDGAGSSTHGSPARLLPNAAPVSRGTPVGLGAPGGPYAWQNDSREHQPIFTGQGPRQLYSDHPLPQHGHHHTDGHDPSRFAPPSAPASSNDHGAMIGNAMMSASNDEDEAERDDEGREAYSVGVARGGASSGDLVSAAAGPGEGRQPVTYPAGDVRNRVANRLSAPVNVTGGRGRDPSEERSGSSASASSSNERAPSAQSGEYHDAPTSAPAASADPAPALAEGYYDSSDNVPSSPHRP